jgi:histidinol-phosphate aminotransferase
MYRMNALYAGARFIGVPLGPGFALDTAAMLDAIERERPALVLLAYPNNPTGNLFDVAGIEAVLRAAPGWSSSTRRTTLRGCELPAAPPRVSEPRHRATVSKIGMAGLRLGYAIAAPEWTTELNKVRQPYNLNALTQAVAPVLLAERALLADQAARIKSERARLGAAFAMQDGVVNFPTQTNFVLVRVPDAPRWFDACGARGSW